MPGGQFDGGTTVTDEIVHWRCEARGLVQRVGYRDRCRLAAKLLKLVGSVRNDPNNEDRVEIEIQGPKAAVGKFLEAIRGRRGMSIPESVERFEELPPSSDLRSFIIHRDLDSQKEQAERMDEAALYLGRVVETGEETLSIGRETLSAAREGNRSLGVKIDTVGEKFDRGSRLLGTKVDGVSKAVAIQGQRTSQFHHDLAYAVRTMDGKYGAISKTLQGIQRDLRAMAKAAEHQARSANRQTAAILKLATQLARVGTRPTGRTTSKR